MSQESEEEEDPGRWVDGFGRKWFGVGTLPWEVVLARYWPGRGHHLGGAQLGFLAGTWGATASSGSSRLVWCWRVRHSGLPSCSEATKQPRCKAETGCQSMEAFGRISCPWCARAVCTWKIDALFLYDFVSGSPFLGIKGVACGVREMTLSGCAMLVSTVDTGLRQYLAPGRISHNFYVDLDSDPEIFLSVLTQNGEVCSADASAV